MVHVTFTVKALNPLQNGKNCDILLTMAVPKQHRSKSRQGQRRMHLYIKALKLTRCPKCSKVVLPHTLCENCGTYRGREMVDVLAKLNKKERKIKRKELQEQGTADPGQGQVAQEEVQKAPQEVTPEQLSQRNPKA